MLIFHDLSKTPFVYLSTSLFCTEKVDWLTWERMTAITDVVDSFPKNVDFVRILFTSHLFCLLCTKLVDCDNILQNGTPKSILQKAFKETRSFP